MKIKQASEILKQNKRVIGKRVRNYSRCARGNHVTSVDGQNCIFCKKSVVNLPKWVVVLSDYDERVLSHEVAAMDAQSALIKALAVRVEYLVQGRTYDVESKLDNAVERIEVNQPLFDHILKMYEDDVYAYKSVFDMKVDSTVTKVVIFTVYFMAVYFGIGQSFPAFKGFLLIFSFALFITWVVYDIHKLNENYKSK